MKNSLTLTELIISITLFAVVILGVSSFHLASEAFLRSSETRTEALNELTFILEHLHKNILQARGDFVDRGIELIGGNTLRLRHDPVGLPSVWVEYVFNSANHQITFRVEPAAATVISDNFVEIPSDAFAIFVGDLSTPANGGVRIDNLAFAFDANTFDPGNIDERNNPVVTTTDAGGNPTVYFFSWSHSWN